jgi:hypothetical protein
MIPAIPQLNDRQSEACPSLDDASEPNVGTVQLMRFANPTN